MGRGAPLFGAVVVGEGVVRLGLLLMSRRPGDKEWQKVVASTYRDHVVLCGLGHMGVRILEYLVERGTAVVVIEKNAEARYMSNARSAKVPVIIAATNDDLANIEVALDARRLNPKIRIAMRQFDPEIAAKLQAGFSIDFAFSSSAVAAPIIAAQALGVSMPLVHMSKGDVALETIELDITAGWPFAGKRIADIEKSFMLRVILARTAGTAWAMPSPEITLQAGDGCVIVGPDEAIKRVA